MILNIKSEKELRKLQKKIAKKVILEDDFSESISSIAGFDLAFCDEEAFASGIVLNFVSLQLKDVKTIKTKLSFPYVSTFLFFREGPPIIKVYKKLNVEPDILMINGHGIAHPLFCGMASHIGVLLNKPTIGIAQNKLCGYYKEPKKVGEASPLFYKGKKVGYVFKSMKNCKPIFVSPGHKISLETSLKVVKECMKDHKLPEPLHLAHHFANEIRNKLKNK